VTAARALVTRVGESSGRSAVAFVSEGFAAGSRSDRERRLPDFQSIVRVASRASVSIYSLNPAGSPAAEDPGGPEARKPGSLGVPDDATQTNASMASRLNTLAVETGGESATGDELVPALARMSRDLDSYYLLSFKPTQPGEGRFHRLELTSKRRNAVVRARAGFWTPSPALVARAEAPPRPVKCGGAR
jgi:VWFA-related protein